MVGFRHWVAPDSYDVSVLHPLGLVRAELEVRG